MSAYIRLASLDDASSIASIYKPYVTEHPISFELEPPSEVEIRERMEGTLTFFPYIVCEIDGKVVGYAYGGKFASRAAYRWSAESTVYLHHDYHRRGIGRALYTSLLAILKGQGYYNVFGGVTLPNAGSVGLHEAMGYMQIALYKKVGYKFGKWHDVGWWQLELAAYSDHPAEPLSIYDLMKSGEFESPLKTGESFIKPKPV